MCDNLKSINELGEKETNDAHYSCKVCRREVSTEEARKEEWYFHIKISSEPINTEYSKMKYFGAQEVDYVCHEHYQTLPEDESEKYIEFGYPYFTALLSNSNGPISF